MIASKEDSNVILRVAAGSPSAKVAGAVLKYMQEGSDVSLIAIGAGAVNQAVKAICIARGMASPAGWNLYCIPAFIDEDVDGTQKTALKFHIRKEIG